MDCLESKLAAAAKQWCGALQEKDDGHKRGVYHLAFDPKMLDLTLNLGATKCPGPVTEGKRKDILH